MIRTLFILWLSIASILSADIRGRLLDTTGRPLPATPLTIEETGDSTSTDLDGGFSLPLPSGTYTLEILDQKVSVVFNEGEVPDIRILVFTHAVSARSNAMETITLSEKTLDRSPGFTLTEALASEADIHMVGIGGALATVSIGGLAKHRVQTTVGGYRVSGDRRAGSDMGTLIPSLLDGITVMKGGTATSYGSEAMGGVVDALLPAFRPVTGISAGILYGENNQRKTFDFQAKGDRWILAGAYDDADSYKTAEGEEEDGFFTRENFYGGYLLQDDRRHTTLDLLYTRGTDIGKPSSSSKPTLYPENILSVAGVRSYGELWQYQAGAIYQKLVTERSGERSTITSTNVQGSIIGTFGRSSLGFHLYTRQGMDAKVQNDDGTTFPLDGATHWELAPNATTSLPLGKNLDLNLGARLQYFRADAGTGTTVSDDIVPAGSVRISWIYGPHVLSAGIFSAYRFPTLEELFYEGPSGRGWVKGNADLDPEDGYGTGLTWRWHSGKFETEASYTLHELNSYIEKIETEPDQYTFRNVQDVRIQDAAIRFLWGSAFSAGLSWARGRDQDSGDVIDDIPPLKASLSLSPSFSAFSPYLHLLGVARQEDYGPSEVEVPGYLVINAGIEYAWNSTVTIGIHAFNLLDKEYMPSADEQAVAAPGRSIVMSIKTNFFSEE